MKFNELRPRQFSHILLSISLVVCYYTGIPASGVNPNVTLPRYLETSVGKFILDLQGLTGLGILVITVHHHSVLATLVVRLGNR